MKRAKLISNGTETYAILGEPGPQGPQGPQGPRAEVATTDAVGIVKPDGTSITVDEDGTIHAETNTEISESEMDEIFTNAYNKVFGNLKNVI